MCCPTVCVTGGKVGLDNVLGQRKFEARKMLENGDEFAPSNARCISPLLFSWL
jgi:hypothetical protein